MIRKKAVLFVVSTLNRGGAQKVISNITTSLPCDFDVDILLNSDENIQYEYKGRIISLQLNEPKSVESLWYQFVVLFKRLKKIKRLKKEKKYDAVVSILTSANVVNVLCKTPDCKTIITEVYMPSETPSKKEKYLIGGLTTLFYNKADCVIAETRVIADNLISNHKVENGKIAIIPNSISVDDIIKQSRAMLKNEEEHIFDIENTIVTAGRMQFQKAQWHLIRAFSEVVKKKPEAKLVIFGEGELKNELLKLVRDYEIESSVLFYGFSKELDKYVAKSCCFVLPSMYEGMPTVLLQSMAVGTPCIVTDFYSGAREVLGDENTPVEHISNTIYTRWGIMTPICSGKKLGATAPLEKEEKMLYMAIYDMLTSKSLRNRYSEAVKERIKSFDNSVIIDKWIRIL